MRSGSVNGRSSVGAGSDRTTTTVREEISRLKNELEKLDPLVSVLSSFTLESPGDSEVELLAASLELPAASLELPEEYQEDWNKLPTKVEAFCPSSVNKSY